MANETASETAGFRGMAEEAFGALVDCFRVNRLTAAGLGIGVAFVLAGACGTAAAVYLLRNALAPAAMLAILGGFVVYTGLLVTFGALCRMAMAERHGQRVTSAEAFSFAVKRSHILVGLPLFTLVVTLGAGSLGGLLGAMASADQALGSALAPVALLVLFLLNVVLICAVLLTHCLTAPCVACLDPSFATVASRITQIGQERLGSFFAHQAAVLLAGVPLIILTTGIFVLAFQPAFQATAAGRAKALLEREIAEAPALAGLDQGGGPVGAADEESDGWLERVRGWAGWASDIGGAPLVSAAAVLALLLGVCPLAFAASAQSTVYLGLTGDAFLAAVEGAEVTPGVEAPPERHPPIVHCWRCDAINRFEAGSCSKCEATLTVCPYCFTTNEPDRPECSSCGRSLLSQETVEAAEAPPAVDG